MADWNALPSDLLIALVERFLIGSSRHRFGAVCRSWQSAELGSRRRRCPSDSPGELGLLIPGPPNSKGRKLYSFAEKKKKKTYDELVSLPVPSHLRIVGSSHGWLVTIDQTSDDATALFNPVSNIKIPLPSSARENWIGLTRSERCPRWDEALPHPYLPVSKAIFSLSDSVGGDPVFDNHDLVVMVIHRATARVAFARPSDRSWTHIIKRVRPRSFEDYPRDVFSVDIIFYEKHFYVLDVFGSVFRVELYKDPPRLVPLAPHPADAARVQSSNYLVESAGQLFQLRRVFSYAGELFNNICKIRDAEWDEYLENEMGYTALNYFDDHVEQSITYITDDDDDEELGGGKDLDDDGRLLQWPPYPKTFEPYPDHEFRDHRLYKTLFFEVFRLDLKGRKWDKVTDLEGRAFVVGQNMGFSVSASDNTSTGFKPNCIYFTDDRELGHYEHTREDFERGFLPVRTGGYDNGIFSLEDETIQPINPQETPVIVPPPVWYMY